MPCHSLGWVQTKKHTANTYTDVPGTNSSKMALGGDARREVGEVALEVAHGVAMPSPRSTAAKLKGRFKETFFPDDPFRQFKGKAMKTKWVLAAQYAFPILQWLPQYRLSMLKSDLVSGLTIASLAIPQGISYAKLANLPPIIGLYSSFVPPLVYAVLGSSRDLAVGPVSIASLIMGSMLSEVAHPNGTTADALLYLQLAFTSTLFAGLFQALLGILRLGFIVDFLSKATLTGFMAGAAIIVSLQQLKALLGIVHFTKQMAIVPVMASVFHKTDEWSWQTVLMGISFLAFLLLTRHFSIRTPKYFWVSAGAPLASVVLSTLLVFAFKAENHGVSVRGLNRPSWDMLRFDGRYMPTVIKTGVMTGITSLAEGIVVGRTFAALKDYKVDGNKEMMAIGLMNVVGSCTSCYVTTGAFSRSAVNSNAGCKSAMSNMVMSLTVMVTLLFLMPLFFYTPNVVLAAIIITAVVGLIDIPAVIWLWKMDKTDFFVAIIAFLGVIFINVQDGLAFAVAISMCRIMLQMIRPKVEALGSIPGTNIYRNLSQYKDATKIPGFLILEIKSPINFTNATYLNDRISRWIEDEEVDVVEQPGLRCIILDLSAVNAVDTNGISFLTDLKKSVEKKGLQLAFVNPLGEVMEKLQRANKANSFLGVDSLYLTVGEAVASLPSNVKGSSAANEV